MIKIEGRKIAQKIIDELKKRPAPKKFLAAFLAGDDAPSKIFVRQKEKIAKELGVDFRIYKIGLPLTNDQLKEKMRAAVSSNLCGGIVLQLPLPQGLNPAYVSNAIPPQKDIDVLSERTLGSFYNGRSKVPPPPVAVVERVLAEAGLELSSIKSVAVVGQGALVGKPIATWLSGKVSETIVLDKGSDLEALKNADLVILGTGSAGLVKASMLKKGAGVIDFGYGTAADGEIAGDFDQNSIAEVGEDYLSFYTPTPGGAGPVLVVCLFENFYNLNQ
jgi:methylenetetrahydrofolate dehydrogenase (NADP+)/methenyltetrahydrofolate cyclohydrolase